MPAKREQRGLVGPSSGYGPRSPCLPWEAHLQAALLFSAFTSAAGNSPGSEGIEERNSSVQRRRALLCQGVHGLH